MPINMLTRCPGWSPGIGAASRPPSCQPRWRSDHVPGAVRKRQQKIHSHDLAHLFTHILMPLSGETESWKALDFGIRLAWREEAHLLGLHVVPPGVSVSSPRALEVQKRFEQRCRGVGIPGELSVESGEIVPTILKRAYYSDLVAIHLAHPPGKHPIKRLEWASAS